MKKTFILIVLFALFGTVGVVADDYKFSWGHTMDGNTSAGDNAVDVQKSSDGCVFVLNTWGSATRKQTYKDAPSEYMHLYIDGVQGKDDQGNEIIGSDYKESDGTSMCNNIALQKMDPVTGNVRWIIYSDRGDHYPTNCHVRPAKDGGAYILIYVRHWAQDKMTILSRIRGTNGTMATLETQQGLWEKDGQTHLYYVPVLVRVSTDGKIEWAKVLWEVQPHKDLQRKPSWLSFINAFTIDSEENLYVAGNFRTKLTFTKKNGEQESITAKNIANWDGDDQKPVGDLYLAKFDKEGNYLSCVVPEGTAGNSYFNVMVSNDDKIYAAGHATGDGTTFKIGTFDITVPETKQSLIVSGFNKDLTPFFALSYDSNADTRALHLNGLQVVDNELYLTGSALTNAGGAWMDKDGNKVIAPTLAMHQGYIVKMKPEDGSVISSGINTKTKSISKFAGIYEAKDTDGKKKIHAFGYDFSMGALDFSFTEDKATKSLTNTEILTVMKSGIKAPNLGIIAVVITPVAYDGRVIYFNRFGKANTANFKTSYLDDTETALVNCWSTSVYSYTDTSILSNGEPYGKAPTKVQDPFVTHAEDGKIYNLSGQYMGTSTTTLPKGIYIRNGKKFIVR